MQQQCSLLVRLVRRFTHYFWRRQSESVFLVIGMIFCPVMLSAPPVAANDAYLVDQGAMVQSGTPQSGFLPGIFSNNCSGSPCGFQFKPGFSFTDPFPRVIGVGQNLTIQLVFKVDFGWDAPAIPNQSSASFTFSGDFGTAGVPPATGCAGYNAPTLRFLNTVSTSYLTPGFHTLTVTVNTCWPIGVGCPVGTPPGSCFGVTGTAFSRSFLINVMPTNVSLLDPIEGLVSGGVMTTNTTLLSTNGRPIAGVAADGVTQALIRIQTPSVGDQFQVTLLNDQNPPAQSGSPSEDGALGQPGDTSFSQSQIVVNASSPNGTAPGYAFVVYRAPADFARSTGPNSFKSGSCNGSSNTDDQLPCRSVSVTVQDITAGSTAIQASVLIVRPPVALIHGLWGDWKNWNSFSPLVLGKGKVDSRFSVLRVNFDQKVGSSIALSFPQYSVSLANVRANSLGLSYNVPTILTQMSDWLQQFRLGHNPGNSSVAAAQLDVIGHSMGGVLTRTLPLTAGYFSDANFDQGLIHKVITIDTPHLGSPLAALLLGSNSDCVREFLANHEDYSFESVTMNGALGLVPGAVGDVEGNGVAVDSSLSGALKAIARTGPQPLPTALIAGVYTNFASLNCTICTANYIVHKCGSNGDPLGNMFTSTAWPLIFGPAGNNNNDAIVGQTSQLNGLSSNFVHSGLLHSAGTEDLSFTGPTVLDPASAPNPVATDVIKLLNTPVTQSSFTSLNP
jgi:pimeloyl-ACP methyl ester carboxylesterase